MNYANDYTLIEKRVPRYGPWGLIKGQSPTGYGSKIPTDHMLMFKGSKRQYRVYCCIYSNIGSCYVIVKGEKLWIRG